MRQLLLTLIAVLLFGMQAHAGLTIYAAEIGVGKFHRMDNKFHKYEASNIWSKFVLPENAKVTLNEPYLMANQDGSVTIFFSNLEDLLVAVGKVAVQRQQKISSININSHGMPGGMWFPMDQKQMNSFECSDWVQTAKAQDDANYKQYYSAVSKNEILQFRQLANNVGAHYSCVVGANEWKTVVGRHPELSNVFDTSAAINLLGCLVGLGKAGEVYNGTIASLLVNDRNAVVKSILNFGLGDWSMPEGLGFWDYLSDTQLNHDNEIYPQNRKDREIMQKGVVRITAFEKGQAVHKLVPDQGFMLLNNAPLNPAVRYYQYTPPPTLEKFSSVEAPASVRIPGTNVTAKRLN